MMDFIINQSCADYALEVLSLSFWQRPILEKALGAIGGAVVIRGERFGPIKIRLGNYNFFWED
jgi:hypothetical protein